MMFFLSAVCLKFVSRALSSLFLLVILRVATVEIHGCRIRIASVPTTAGLGTGSDGTAECSSRRRAYVGRSSDQDHNWTMRSSRRPDKWDGSEKATGVS